MQPVIVGSPSATAGACQHGAFRNVEMSNGDERPDIRRSLHRHRSRRAKPAERMDPAASSGGPASQRVASRMVAFQLKERRAVPEFSSSQSIPAGGSR